MGQPAVLTGVTDLVYDRSPEVTDRALNKLRSAAVSAPELAEVARSLRVGRNIRLGRGEKAGGGANKDSILADTLTALIGAVRLRFGMDQTLALVYRLFDEPIERLLLLGPGLDWKDALKDLAKDEGLEEPVYEAEQSGGRDHDAEFTAWVWGGEVKYGSGKGRSFKEAEKNAAEIAWRAISGQTTGGVATPRTSGDGLSK
ncbi:ribonuclease III family protein [Spirillospora sp. CA-142024]|uniref:ribonuclease III family protein n=1 Tax=Spirillospora sp. CA-142024 TaxID=3240036 RepID=UPI003D8EAFEC